MTRRYCRMMLEQLLFFHLSREAMLERSKEWKFSHKFNIGREIQQGFTEPWDNLTEY